MCKDNNTNCLWTGYVEDIDVIESMYVTTFNQAMSYALECDETAVINSLLVSRIIFDKAFNLIANELQSKQSWDKRNVSRR